MSMGYQSLLTLSSIINMLAINPLLIFSTKHDSFHFMLTLWLSPESNLKKGLTLSMAFSQKINCKMYSGILSFIVLFSCLAALFSFSGCATAISSATSNMMNHLSRTILNNDDLSLVETGAPAYLLMIDSLITQDPENEQMLSTAADLYAAYADVFVKNKTRSQKMTQKALTYANTAMCLALKDACSLKEKSYKEFETVVSTMTKQDVPVLFSLGNAWAGWILANKNDLNAIADMARIEYIMQKIVELDRTYKDGAAFVYLGTMATLLPPALGGKPEAGKHYFETALEISSGKNLMIKVMYAKFYARMIFDQTLHDQLLNDVLKADPQVPGYTLINTYAVQQAKELLKSATDYF